MPNISMGAPIVQSLRKVTTLQLETHLMITDPDLSALLAGPSTFSVRWRGGVSDSGEGRWTIKAAIDEAVPSPVLTTALYERFSSRGEADFANKLLSAMRFQFGGHHEKPADKSQAA